MDPAPDPAINRSCGRLGAGNAGASATSGTQLTSELLDPWLRLAGALEGLEVKTYHAPYGLNLEESDARSRLVAHSAHITLMLLRREDLHPDMARPVVALSPDEQANLSSQVLDRLFAIIKAFRAQRVGHLLVTILPEQRGPALGVYDPQSERSEAEIGRAHV